MPHGSKLKYGGKGIMAEIYNSLENEDNYETQILQIIQNNFQNIENNLQYIGHNLQNLENNLQTTENEIGNYNTESLGNIFGNIVIIK
jgi:hypothetical protein